MTIPSALHGVKRNGTIYYGDDVDFERIRRITGYLVGTLDRFNNAKRAEESQRVKHGAARDFLK